MSHTDVRSSSPPEALPKPAWRLNAALFLATLVAVFVTALETYAGKDESLGFSMSHGTYLKALQFVGSLMTILVAHELGHYIAARIHRVDASLPFFIPMPLLSPFGTMGAVIRMRGTIPTRRALLDIGASGPLAGMCFALPLYIWGLTHSEVVPWSGPGEGMVELGEPLIVKALDHFFAPATPDGTTLSYSPVAFGAWGGMFVTMINLLPVGQLDGGHVAYALFGQKQDRYAMTAHRAMLAFFGVIVVGHLLRDLSSGRAITAALSVRHIASALFWLVWFQVLAILGTLAKPADDGPNAKPMVGWRIRISMVGGLAVLVWLGQMKASFLVVGAFFVGLALLVAMEAKAGAFREHELLVHPPTGPEPMNLGRKLVAVFTLVLFALLFMPEPFSF